MSIGNELSKGVSWGGLKNNGTTRTDISNTVGSLCGRLGLDVFIDKDHDSRDYGCGIKVDEEFETEV